MNYAATQCNCAICEERRTRILDWLNKTIDNGGKVGLATGRNPKGDIDRYAFVDAVSGNPIQNETGLPDEVVVRMISDGKHVGMSIGFDLDPRLADANAMLEGALMYKDVTFSKCRTEGYDEAKPTPLRVSLADCQFTTPRASLLRLNPDEALQRPHSSAHGIDPLDNPTEPQT